MTRCLPLAIALALAACTDPGDRATPTSDHVGEVPSWANLLRELNEVHVCDGYDCAFSSEVADDGISSATIRSTAWTGGVGAPVPAGPDAGEGVAACAVLVDAGYDAVQAWGNPDEVGWHLLAESGPTQNGCHAVAAGSRP